MELYKEILIKVLENSLEKAFFDLSKNIGEAVEGECYSALKKIKTIVEDDSLSDCECFMKIEKIVTVLEDLGLGGGSRHDFG